MNILDRYFELSDVACHDETKFQELINLFSDNPVIRPFGKSEVVGKRALQEFYKAFFKDNIELNHVWETKFINNCQVEVSWSVHGIKTNGKTFSLEGTDVAKLNNEGKIQFLEVKVSHRK